MNAGSKDINQKAEEFSDSSSADLEFIAKKEPEVAIAICMVIEHIKGCYEDKYEKGVEVIDTKKQLYGKDGAAINIYQVTRYLQRYNTSGSLKSGLVKDLLKAIHYIVFEITRRIKNNDVKLNEPAV